MKKYLTAIFLIIGFVAAAPLVGNAADTENCFMYNNY